MKFLDKDNSIIKDNIEIKCYAFYEGHEKLWQNSIKSSSAKREWMDEANQSYAYYCTPLVAANQLGYNIIYPHETEIFWNGGDQTDDVKIIHAKRNPLYYNSCMSHFSIGIITFDIHVLFRTPPGWGLLVSGPANYPVRGLQALEALVETNWSPYSFTMNFKITEKNKLIKISEGTPICRIMPYPLNLNEKTSMKFLNIKDDKSIYDAHQAWAESRRIFNSTKRDKSSNRQFFYRDGVDPSGNMISDGMHKLDYKFNLNINTKENKCPFLSNLFKS